MHPPPPIRHRRRTTRAAGGARPCRAARRQVGVDQNAFRFGKDVLPRDEGAALWAEFDVEMNRLYAVMNEGKEPDLGD
jgi:hypothetical protein